jgi:hypothetical protein
MPKTFKFDQYQKEARRTPFVLDGPFPEGHPASEGAGGPGSITIPVPSGRDYIKAEQAGSSGQTLRVVCGQQWEQIDALLDCLDAGGVIDLTRDVMQHFGIGEDNRPPGGGQR